MEKHYDVLIIGGGPAGLAAAVYAARSGATTAVVEALTAGGVAAATPMIENYPGFASISGYELAQKMAEQAAGCGAQFLYAKAEKIEDGEEKKVLLSSGETVRCTALVLALGNEPKKLGVPDEASWLGGGLSYCATCDGNFFRGKTVAVAGAGYYADEAVAYLRPLAAKLYRIHTKSIPQSEGVVCLENTRVVRFEGKPLRALQLETAGKEHELAVDGLFVELGYTPAVGLIRGLVETDSAGYVVCDEQMRTSAEGIFAAGDARSKPLRQIVTAVSDGAVAGQFAAAFARKRMR